MVKIPLPLDSMLEAVGPFVAAFAELYDIDTSSVTVTCFPSWRQVHLHDGTRGGIVVVEADAPIVTACRAYLLAEYPGAAVLAMRIVGGDAEPIFEDAGVAH